MSTCNFEFSVLLSVYQKENPDYLKSALESIWDSQIFKPNEIVIIKDGILTKDLDSVIDEFRRVAPVKLLENAKNEGLSFSLNRGLEACSNDLVARMDTDDISMPERFKLQIESFKSNPNLDILGSYAIKVDKIGNEIGLLRRPITNNDIYRNIWSNPIIHPSVMFKREKILLVGNYEQNPKKGSRHDDYELWFRCAQKGLVFENIPNPLIYYRYIEETVTRNDLNVAIQRFKVGLKGCYRLKIGLIGYIGILIPLFRSLLPYPLNVYFNKLMLRINPRNK